MNLYKLDFDGKKFFSHAYQARNEADFSKEPKTKLVDSANSHFITKAVAEDDVVVKNQNLVHTFVEGLPSSSIIVKRCTKCKGYFIIDYHDWLSCKESEIELPHTCDECRGYSLK